MNEVFLAPSSKLSLTPEWLGTDRVAQIDDFEGQSFRDRGDRATAPIGLDWNHPNAATCTFFVVASSQSLEVAARPAI
jgi:hypothetical protein